MPRKRRRHTAGGDQNLLAGDGRWCVARDFDNSFAFQLAVAKEAFNLVLLQQALDTTVERADDRILVAHHLRDIERHALNDETSFGKMLLRLLVQFAGFEQCLAGNTTHSQAGPAELLFAFDDSDFHAQLRGSNGGDVSARTSTNNNQIE
jgi:hypothetical protein